MFQTFWLKLSVRILINTSLAYSKYITKCKINTILLTINREEKECTWFITQNITNSKQCSIFILFNVNAGISYDIPPNDRMSSEYLAGMDVEGKGRGLI
jgi:hypothetical protein